MTKPSLLVALALSCSCAASPATSTTSRPGASPARPVEDRALGEFLAAEGYGGVIALLDADGKLRCSDVVACEQRSKPASTFKIANAMIALETGVAADASFVIPWDGVTRDIPDWNRDHTLKSAYDSSCVPCFQEIARRIGLERMGTWVARLDYGNADIGSVVDRFWLDGPLAISPVEQIRFLERLETGALPISARTRDILREIMIRDRRGDTVLRGKTGWATEPEERGWFVGYATRGSRTSYVAVRAIRGPGMDDATFLGGRMRVATRVLEAAARE